MGKAVYGRNASIFSKFNRFTFQQGLDNLHIFLTSGELTSIFQTLDKNKDNLLDIKEITNGFYTESKYKFYLIKIKIIYQIYI